MTLAHGPRASSVQPPPVCAVAAAAGGSRSSRAVSWVSAVSRLRPSQCCCHIHTEYQLWLCIALKVNQALKSAFPLVCGSESCEARS